MRFFIQLSVIVLVFIGYSVSASGQGIPAPSEWIGPKGSKLVIQTLDPNSQKLTGTYTNNAPEFAPGFGCQGTPYPIDGVIYGHFITWTVVWFYAQNEDCKSITSWSGYYIPGEIRTLWTTIYKGVDGPEILPAEGSFKRVE